MASVNTIAQKYPKYKIIAKFKEMVSMYSQQAPLVSYYCLLRIADVINRNFFLTRRPPTRKPIRQ